MQLTILGNQGPFPGVDGACSSYLVECKGRVLMMDCGSGAVRALQALGKLHAVEAVLLSHLHFDHISDLLMMQYALAPEQLPLDVYAPAEPKAVWELLSQQPNLAMHEVHGGMQLEILGLEVKTCAGVHPVPSVGYRIESVLAYTGDTNECPEMIPFAHKARLLLADCGVDEALWTPAKPHLSPERVGKLACEAGVDAVMLTHFAPTQDVDAAVKAAEAAGVKACAAERMMTYVIAEN